MSAYSVVEYQSLTDTKLAAFLKFAKEAGDEVDQPAHHNMWDTDWKTVHQALPYILTFTVRYRETGRFNIVFYGEQVVACGGVYIAPFCKSLALAGSRTWVAKSHRNKNIPREVLLPLDKKWAIDHTCGAIALTFNDYNKNLIALWLRSRLGKSLSKREPKHMFYNGVNEVEFPVNIQYCKQWVIYEKLISDWSFDWEDIKWK